MPQPWNDETIPPAFTKTLEEAVKKGNDDFKKDLLDPSKAKAKFAKFADIDVPENVTIRFYEEEVLPIHFAIAIPAATTGPTVPKHPRRPTFDDCFVGLYDTYRSVEEHETLKKILD